jgi:hypothetical protein
VNRCEPFDLRNLAPQTFVIESSAEHGGNAKVKLSTGKTELTETTFEDF